MTEMVYGSVPAGTGEPILPRWWRTIDKWSVSCVLMLFSIGLLLGLASSPPLAERNGFSAFHYVERQVVFGTLALTIMFVITMMSPKTVRRLAVLGFAVSFVAVALLPVFGTDFGKGAVRWYSLGFASLQPSEFLKPGFIVLVGWMIAASNEVAGPPGKTYSFAIALVIVLLLAFQPDFGQACLILFSWGVMYFVGGAPFLILAGIAGMAVLAGRAYGFHNCGRSRRIWADPGSCDHLSLRDDRSAVAFPSDARTRPVHPAGRHRVGLYVCHASDDQHERCGTVVARQGHDLAFCQLWRVVTGGGWHSGRHVVGPDAQQAAR